MIHTQKDSGKAQQVVFVCFTWKRAVNRLKAEDWKRVLLCRLTKTHTFSHMHIQGIQWMKLCL